MAMMQSETMAMPQGWGEESIPMALRLVTAGDHSETLHAATLHTATKAPAAGIVIGVFSGSMFWLGLAIGWTLWS